MRDFITAFQGVQEGKEGRKEGELRFSDGGYSRIVRVPGPGKVFGREREVGGMSLCRRSMLIEAM